MTLPRGFAESVARFPDKPAAVLGDEALSFAALEAAAAAQAARLAAAGVRHGDRVAVLVDHGGDTAAALWACWRLGAVAVPLNGRLGDEPLAHIVESCEPTVVLRCGRFRDEPPTLPVPDERQLDASVDDAAPATGASASAAPDARVPTPPPPPGAATPGAASPAAVPTGNAGAGTAGGDTATVADDDLAAIVYTSGSTGRPKGVCLTHRNLESVARAAHEHMPVTSDTSYLMVVPLHYVHGLAQLIIHHLAGATIHFSGDFLFPGEIVRKLAATGVTDTSGTPFHMAMMLQRGKLLDADLPNWKRFIVVGGKLNADHARKLIEGRPGTEVHVCYGLTECAPRATALRPEHVLGKPDAVGRPIPGVTVEVLGDDGEPLPQGETGEVVVSGPNIMAGYWRDPEGTAERVDARGRLHTGDLGWFDPDGDLRLAGRADSMIKSAGERIFPAEIEKVLLADDDVDEAVVVGVPDDTLGQRVEAHVQLRAGAAADGSATGAAPTDIAKRLRDACLKALPLGRVPAKFHTWHAFPRRPNGKVDRPALLQGPPTVP